MTTIETLQQQLALAKEVNRTLSSENSRLRKMFPSDARKFKTGSVKIWDECYRRMRAGEIDFFKDLLDFNKVTMSDVDSSKRTLLALASKSGNYEIAQMCLNLGADLEHLDNDGQNSISLSQDGAWYHIEKLLLFHQLKQKTKAADQIELENNAKTILRQQGFIENIIAGLKAHKNSKQLMETLVDVMIGIIQRKQNFSEDILLLCWNFICHNSPCPLKSEFWSTWMQSCQDVINSDNVLWWHWFKTFVLPSTIWLENKSRWEPPEPEFKENCPKKHGLTKFITPSHNFGCDICHRTFPSSTTMHGCRKCNYDVCAECYSGGVNPVIIFMEEPEEDLKDDSESNLNSSNKNEPYLYFELLHLAKQRSAELSSQLEKELQANQKTLQEIIKFDIFGSVKKGRFRQDQLIHGIKCEYDIDALSRVNRSTTEFNICEHYDRTQYLSKLIFCAHTLDDKFHKSIQSILDINTISNNAYDDNGDEIEYDRLAVKSMNDCTRILDSKSPVKQKRYPKSAFILDFNQCRLVCNTPHSLVWVLNTLQQRVHNGEAGTIVDILFCDNEFKKLEDERDDELFSTASPFEINCYVLLQGQRNDLIAKIQIVWKPMQIFKQKLSNLELVTDKQEFVSKHVAELLPMLIDHEKLLFVHGNFGDVEGFYDLIVVNNKSPQYVLSVDEVSHESILLNMAALGHVKALDFLQTIVPNDYFANRVFYPNRYNMVALEAAIEKKGLPVVKSLLSNPKILSRYLREDAFLVRLLITSLRFFDTKVWNYITRMLRLNKQMVHSILTFKTIAPIEGEFAKGHYTYHDKTLQGICCYNDNPLGTEAIIDMLGDEMFTENAFNNDMYNVNPIERCVQLKNFKQSKYLLNIEMISLKLAANSNQFYRYLLWTMRCADDEFLEWFRNEFNLTNTALLKYIDYEYPAPTDEQKEQMHEHSWTYHDTTLLHWTIRGKNEQRCQDLMSLIRVQDWMMFLMRADGNRWRPFEIVLHLKLFEFGEYILDNVESQHRKTLIMQGWWLKEDSVRRQVRKWKYKYLD